MVARMQDAVPFEAEAPEARATDVALGSGALLLLHALFTMEPRHVYTMT
jgi:hypothetical protein